MSVAYTTGSALRETSYINRSLTFLDQVVNAINRGDVHIPYRQAKLTSILADALGGNSRTALIANIQVSKEHIDETIATLRFAQRVRNVTTKVNFNLYSL